MTKDFPKSLKPIKECNWWQKLFWTKKKKFAYKYGVVVGPIIKSTTKFQYGELHHFTSICRICRGGRLRPLKLPNSYSWGYIICLACPTIMTPSKS